MTANGLFRAVSTIATVFLLCAPSFADDAAEVSAAVERAEELILAAEPEAALELLRPLADRHPADTDVHFFRGLAALNAARLVEAGPDAAAGREASRALLDEAVESFRHILALRPGLAGARLQLAQALFQRGRCTEPPQHLLEHVLGDDCDAAAHHFRRALAGGLPPEVVATVSRFLAVVRARKRVSGQFSMSLAPDSNINSGTEARTFRLRVLPLEFQVDEDTRATSGVGVVVSASGEYRHPLDLQLFEESATRLRLGTSLYRREHEGSRFDDMSASLQVGPEALFQRSRASLLVKGDRRWSGGTPSSHGLGLRIEGGRRIGEQLWLGGSVQRMERRHYGGTSGDGPRLDLDFDLAYAATPAITFGLRGGWQRIDAEFPTRRSRTRRIGAFVGADMPPILGVAGFVFRLSQDMLFTDYDEPGYTLINPDARSDRLLISRLTVFNEQLEFEGFAPTLALVHERRNTNIADIFDYRRNRAELTFRRLF